MSSTPRDSAKTDGTTEVHLVCVCVGVCLLAGAICTPSHPWLLNQQFQGRRLFRQGSRLGQQICWDTRKEKGSPRCRPHEEGIVWRKWIMTSLIPAPLTPNPSGNHLLDTNPGVTYRSCPRLMELDSIMPVSHFDIRLLNRVRLEYKFKKKFTAMKFACHKVQSYWDAKYLFWYHHQQIIIIEILIYISSMFSCKLDWKLLCSVWTI